MEREQEDINTKYIEALGIVQERLFGTTHGDAIACDLHDLLCDNDEDHNCIACNLASAMEGIKLDISRIIHTSNSEYPELDFRLYVLSLYLFVERANVVRDIIKLAKNYKEKEDYFDVFTDIKRWANFFKHPRSFMLAHHPVFLATEPQPDSEYTTIINTQIVRDNWTNKAHSTKYTEEYLVNNDRVAVVMPDIVVLTNRFCDAIDHLLTIPKENKMVRNILRDKATLQAYFEKLATESISEESPDDK